MTFAYLGVTLKFEGVEEHEVGKVESIDLAKQKELGIPNCELNEGDVLVMVDKKYYRPTEVDLLIGDPTKSNEKLGWKPKYDLQALVNDMMQSDLELMKKDQYLKHKGYKVLGQYE